MIILWGSKGAGKTTFLTALYYAIEQSKKKWVMYAAPDDELSRKFIIDGYKKIVEQNTFPLPTDTQEVENGERIFQFDIGKKPTWPFSKLMYYLRKGKYNTIRLNFLDPAGEFFEQPDNKNGFEKYISKHIKNSRGLLCLIDPEREIEPSTNQKSYFELLYENFSRIRSLYISSSSLDKIPIPIAICLTKMDQHKDQIKNPYGFAKKVMGDLAFNLIETFFQPNLTKFFACSSVGFKKDGSPNLTQGPDFEPKPAEILNPFNIIEPIEWIMYKSNQINKYQAYNG